MEAPQTCTQRRHGALAERRCVLDRRTIDSCASVTVVENTRLVSPGTWQAQHSLPTTPAVSGEESKGTENKRGFCVRGVQEGIAPTPRAKPRLSGQQSGSPGKNRFSLGPQPRLLSPRTRKERKTDTPSTPTTPASTPGERIKL